MVGTNIRTLVLTFIVMGAVQAPLKAFSDPTGTTALSVAEMIPWPAAMPDSSAYGLLIHAAPFGHSELSKASLALFMPQIWTSLALFGQSGGGWTNLALSASRIFSITPHFKAGVNLTGGYQGAQGFASHGTGSLGIQAQFDVSSKVSATVAFQDLIRVSTGDTKQSQRIFIGIGWLTSFPMSASIHLAPYQNTSIRFAVARKLNEFFKARLAVETQPLAASIATSISSPTLPPLLIEFEYVGGVGLRTAFGVDF